LSKEAVGLLCYANITADSKKKKKCRFCFAIPPVIIIVKKEIRYSITPSTHGSLTQIH
jgi:hypothetical protein